MAYHALSRNTRPVAPPITVAPGQPVRIVDARVSRAVAAATTPNHTDRSLPETSSSSSSALPETSSSSSSAPRVVQAIIEPLAAVDRQIPKSIIVAYDDRSQPERHLDATGHVSSDPGRQLAVTMRKRRMDDVAAPVPGKERIPLHATLALHANLRQTVNDHDDLVAFMAERVPTVAKTIQPKYVRSKHLEKRGKLLRYDKVDKTKQSPLRDLRLVDLKYAAVTVISDTRCQQLVLEGAEVLPPQ